MDALAVSGAMRLGKTCQIVGEVAAKTFWEFLPGGLGDLDRRLRQLRGDQPSRAVTQEFQARTIGRRVALPEAIRVNSAR